MTIDTLCHESNMRPNSTTNMTPTTMTKGERELIEGNLALAQARLTGHQEGVKEEERAIEELQDRLSGASRDELALP